MIHNLNVDLKIEFPKLITYHNECRIYLDGIWSYRVKQADVNYIYTLQNPNNIMRFFTVSLLQGIVFDRQNHLTEHINKDEFTKYMFKRYIG